jgi:hypothetical protein
LRRFDEKSSIISRDDLTDADTLTGIRELNEGVLKYQDADDCMELNDRILCISAYYRLNERFYLAERKQNMYKHQNKLKLSIRQENDLKYEIYQVSMQLTPDIIDLI